MSPKKPKSKNTNSAKHLLTSDSQAPVTSHVPLIAQETIIGDLRRDKDEGFHRFFDCVDKLEPNRKFAYTTPNGLVMQISRLPQKRKRVWSYLSRVDWTNNFHRCSPILSDVLPGLKAEASRFTVFWPILDKMKIPCNPIPNDASILYQDLVIQLAVKANMTIGVAPLVLEQNDCEVVCWLAQHCGKPAEILNATGKLRTYTWSYHGAGIFLSQKRLLQLPTGQNRSLQFNFAQKRQWNLHICSQMLKGVR